MHVVCLYRHIQLKYLNFTFYKILKMYHDLTDKNFVSENFVHDDFKLIYITIFRFSGLTNYIIVIIKH